MNGKPGTFITLLGDSFRLLIRKDPLNLAGATAFFATFALPPILITMLQILRLVLQPGESNLALLDKLSRMVGDQSARQILRTLDGFSKVADKWWVAAAGFLFLLFIGTTLFKVIKNSLNHVWGIVVVGERSFIEKINPRLKALMVICAAGILFLIVVFAEGFQAFVSQQFKADSPLAALLFNRIISFIISVIISTAWFALIFILLPDAVLPVRIGVLGALFTAVLFSLGKWLIRWLLLRGDFNSIFGASTSMVLLLLFVFYSSFIFYYGAAFTKLCAEYYHQPVKPYKYAQLADL